MKEILKLGSVLFIICMIAALALAATNEVTAPIIEKQKMIKSEMARKEVLPVASSFEKVEADFDAIVTLDSGSEVPVLEVYQGLDNSGVVGYVVKSTPGGYGGNIEVITGIDINGSVTGVRIGSHQETPGLGTKAKEPAFYNQFDSKSALEVRVNKSAASDTEVQAISGATITSNAVTAGVNASGKIVSEIGK